VPNSWYVQREYVNIGIGKQTDRTTDDADNDDEYSDDSDAEVEGSTTMEDFHLSSVLSKLSNHL
jgi:hypothetical protein